MAQAGEWSPAPVGGLIPPPNARQQFHNLRVVECGGRAFQVNNESCTNNVINGGQFLDNAQGGLCQPRSKPVTARDLTVRPVAPIPRLALICFYAKSHTF